MRRGFASRLVTLPLTCDAGSGRRLGISESQLRAIHRRSLSDQCHGAVPGLVGSPSRLRSRTHEVPRARPCQPPGASYCPVTSYRAWQPMPVPERPEWFQRPLCGGRGVPSGSHCHLKAMSERGTIDPPPSLNSEGSGTCSKCAIIRNYPRLDADDRGVCGNRRVGMKAPRACRVESSGLSLRTSERHINQMNIRCKARFPSGRAWGTFCHVCPDCTRSDSRCAAACSSPTVPPCPVRRAA